MKEIKTKNQKDLKKVLIKKALGYEAVEIIEEYVSGEEGEIKLTKKKVTKKNVPPDLSALKMLMDSQEQDLNSLTDQELLKEKERLLLELKKQCKEK